MLEIIFAFLLSYVIGSLPTAILAGKILKNIDIREHGSGNAGATNVFRILGWKAGILVLLIDMFKGFVVVWWLVNIIPDANTNIELRTYFQIILGLAAIFGHIWTIFAGFHGGKGVGTAAGVFLGFMPIPVLICLIVFIIIVAKTHYVSLGSMTGAVLLPVILVIEKFYLNVEIPVAMLVLSIALMFLILITHRENIDRLRQGKENKLNFSRKEEAS
jgi:glycerol-3-phosphate acyltransferase PlsY